MINKSFQHRKGLKRFVQFSFFFFCIIFFFFTMLNLIFSWRFNQSLDWWREEEQKKKLKIKQSRRWSLANCPAPFLKSYGISFDELSLQIYIRFRRAAT